MAFDPGSHPQFERFVAAISGEGFEPGEMLPVHHPGCYGCGPDNPVGLKLEARAAEDDAVEAVYTFDERFEGGPGVVHGGAIAALIDDLFGRLLVRMVVLAVTAELSLAYLRPVHVDEPCELRAELVGRGGRDERDLMVRAWLTQGEQRKVRAEGRFRVIDLDRLANRYARGE